MSLSEIQIEALLERDHALRALARGLLSDAHAAEDVAQEAWLAALQRGERAASLPGWFAGVVRNLAGKRRRGEERRSRRERDSARAERDPSTAEILEREAARTKVVAAVLALEEPYRATVLLRYFENLPPRAIARRHGVPVETVRTRQKRALEILRARLDHDFGERGAWCALLAPFARGAASPPLGRIAESLPPVLVVAVMSTQAKIAGAALGAALIAFLFWNERGSPVLSGADVPAPVADHALAGFEKEAPGERMTAVPPAERAPLAVVAPPPPATSTALGSVRVLVTWFDDSPAEAVRVLVEPNWSEEGPTLKTRFGLTDAQGEALIDEVPAGAARVTLDRGPRGSGAPMGVAEIAPGGEAELTLTIPRGFDVTGVVLDPSGAPVSAADVWVSRQLQLGVGHVLARTDERGRFELRSLAAAYIGARAAGYAPSLCQSMLAGEGAEFALELVLMGPGGAVEGTVLDPEGRLLANAWVVAGLDFPAAQVRMVPVGGTKRVAGTLPGPIETRTDAEGRYRIDGLAPGTRRMAVRASGFGAWRGEVEVVEQRTRRQDVRLAPGVTLVGSVQQADGRPARASVEIGEHFSLLRTSTETDEAGSFRLEGLEAGELVVHASGGRDGEARSTLRAVAGETLTWQARLVQGGEIRGRVLDETGEPLAGWPVRVEDDPHAPEDPDLDFAETDSEGRFVFQDMHERPHRVEVHSPDNREYPAAVAMRVQPGVEGLLLVVESAQLPSASIVGRVVDELGQPADGAQLVLVREMTKGGTLHHPDPSGRFELGPLPPGQWTLRAGSPELADHPFVVVGPRELEPDETWDCGTIVIERGGTLAVTVRDLGPEAELSFTVLREGVFPGPLLREGEAWRSGPLQVGAYLLQVRGRGVAATRLPFEIRSGEVTRLELALDAGQTVQIRIRVPGGGEGTRVSLRVGDARGEEVFTDEPWLWPDAERNVTPGDFGTEVALAPGSYQVDVWLEDGRRATAELRVEHGEAEPLVLELR